MGGGHADVLKSKILFPNFSENKLLLKKSFDMKPKLELCMLQCLTYLIQNVNKIIPCTFSLIHFIHCI